MIEATIVVIAYNRVKPLKRLLKSLAEASYPSKNINLHISIDASNNSDVKNTADNFEWKFGQKIVDLKSENLGLLKHVLECGKLTEKYESIIVLEDDLLVAPGFYQYAQTANQFYIEDDKVAGVSLFTYPVEENSFYPFQPIQDDSDVHFIQVASSWGQSWNKEQWSKFKSWLTENANKKELLLPAYILEWGNNSWKKLFINYLIDTDRYFVFPNTSYSTNFEEEGTHSSQTGLFQVPLNLGFAEPRFKKWSDSNSVYDAYFELKSNCLKSLCPDLKRYDFEVDIFGNKPLESISSEYILTSKRAVNVIAMSFGSVMKPLLQNVLHEIAGDDLLLCRKENVILSESNRFSALHSSSVQLDQASIARRQKLERVTIVIPTLNNQLDELKRTITNLETDRFYNVVLLVAYSPEIQQSVKDFTEMASVEIQLVPCSSEKIDDLLHAGIENCSTDYCTWMQPGMAIDPERMEGVANIFQGMKHVQVLQGLKEKANQNTYAKLNTSNARWTPQRANSNKSEAGKIRTEFVFWRKTLIPEKQISNLTTANLFLELLKLNPIYAVALKLGDVQQVNAVSSLSAKEIEKSLEASEFQPKSVFRSLTRPIFQYWFRRNVPFFRLFYRESEQLPLVIRYDFENDSYYLSNY